MTKNKLSSLTTRAYQILPLLTVFLCALFAVFLQSCAGGGTDGSGVRSFEGQVLSEDAQPLAGASVTLEQTGETTVTDESGGFRFSTNLPAEETSATFVIQDQNVSASATLSDLTPGSTQNTVLIVVNRPANTAQVISLTTPTPIPAATAVPATATSVPPTVLAGPTSPGATATPTPTEVALQPTATSTPTATPVPESDVCRCDTDFNSYVNANDFQTALNQYSMGGFDFNGDGLHTAADLNDYSALCGPFAGERCYEHL